MDYVLIHGNACYIPLAANSVDSIVCDPPYHLVSIVKRFGSSDAAPAQFGSDGRYARVSKGFMGKTWDGGDVAHDPLTWVEALRVAKPGAHLLAFGGTRTWHRLACAIEDAGWELRDTLMWVYGKGFPKSHDVSKAIDKAAGAKRESIGTYQGATNIGRKDDGKMGYAPGTDYPDDVDTTVHVTLPATDEARQWDGWGTALKPAWEPVIMARKPLEGTVAANVLKWGTGAINIRACRVAAELCTRMIPDPEHKPVYGSTYKGREDGSLGGMVPDGLTCEGRWPANFIHDGSDEVVGMFPENAPGSGTPARSDHPGDGVFKFGGRANPDTAYSDSGSAARFFYSAKAGPDERDFGMDGAEATMAGVGALRDGGRSASPRSNTHPTVKPVSLMRYLCRLVTPPGGIVLDQFMGSGSTGIAALAEGFSFIGIDLSSEYVAIAQMRVGHSQLGMTLV